MFEFLLCNWVVEAAWKSATAASRGSRLTETVDLLADNAEWCLYVYQQEKQAGRILGVELPMSSMPRIYQLC
jgi:hypothetical protein